MRVLSLLLLTISVCTGREHHHSLGALKPHSMSETIKEPTYLELKLQNSKLTRENEILKAQGSGMERAAQGGTCDQQLKDVKAAAEYNVRQLRDVKAQYTDAEQLKNECEEALKNSEILKNSEYTDSKVAQNTQKSDYKVSSFDPLDR